MLIDKVGNPQPAHMSDYVRSENLVQVAMAGCTEIVKSANKSFGNCCRHPVDRLDHRFDTLRHKFPGRLRPGS